MNSRRLIASPKVKNYANFGLCCWQVQQETAISEMGCNRQFAMQKFLVAHDRCGVSTSGNQCADVRSASTSVIRHW